MDITETRHAMYQHGFAVIPVIGKNPAIEEWQNISANTDTINLWPSLYPSHNNTGILTKYTPAFDVDLLNPEAAEAVETLVRSLFEERGIISPRIGRAPKRAFLFRTNKPFPKLSVKLINRHGVAGEKFEILCNGQQLVVHGIHPDTKQPYSWPSGAPWDALRVADLPLLTETVAKELLRDARELVTAEYGYTIDEGEEDGANGTGGAADWGRLINNILTGADLHESIARLAFSFIATGIPGSTVVTRLRELMDRSQAKTNRPKDWQDRYADIARAVRTAQEKLEVDIAAPAGGPKPDPIPKPDPPKPDPPKPDPPQLPAAVWHGDVNPIDSRPCLVEGLIPEEGCGLISGQWGSYKTFNAIELAHCVMTGRPFLGFEIQRPGGVLFFALEGASELAVRLQGALDHKGAKRFTRAPFAWHISLPLPLTYPRAADIIIKMAEPVAARLKAEFNLPLSLIEIDTIVTGADYQREGQDNDVATTHRMMMTMARVARALHCFVFGVDHYGKDASVGTRGSSVKEGDADVILACLADKTEAGKVSNHRLALRKRRNGSNGEEFPFRTQVVEVGTNKYGKPETTLVISYGEDPNAPPKPARDDDWGKAKPVLHLKKVIMSLMAEHGQDIHPFPDGKPIRALKVELVEAEFLRSYPVSGRGGDNKEQIQDTKRRAFKRGLEDAAIKKNVIVTREIHGVDWVWFATKSPDENAGPTGPTENA
jgi:hypothetical protein